MAQRRLSVDKIEAHLGVHPNPAYECVTRRLAIMNLAIRGIGKEHADTFRNVEHPDLRADTATRVSAKPKPRSHSAGHLHTGTQLLASPPFNDSDTAMRDSARHDCEAYPQVIRGAKDSWSKDDDVRWQFGVPPKGNANFAWVQHFIHYLAPQGMAGFVLANGSMSSNQSGDCNARSARREWATNWQGLGSQRDIRRALIEADLVDTALRDSAILQSEAIPQVLIEAKNNMVALPGQLFYSTQIPVCLWFCGKTNTLDSANDARLFDGETELSLVA